MRVSLSRKLQQMKGNEKYGKNTEKIDWLLHEPIKSLLKKNFDALYKQTDKPFNEQ